MNANEIADTTHECIGGEEAFAVGVCSVFKQDDIIASTHRGHGHITAKGGDVSCSGATGYNWGEGGSMHIAALSITRVESLASGRRLLTSL